ncbi:MAG TPA: phospho-N-acetylmuramoyl-pentapeptide-transferase [Phycisphaerae bacterium]|nr:phospho-N-acetylmuramoyl-pentapeptide-transferase [Phycisphaerae bacterium]HOJ74654.1 phospho-N-acetylmuramoyl-pentapeptide-transferase [Phycisphaerae bacterium]HOM50553.1 phospho-N-acetylmuramoyl-pentapeptide-transferase [Phycisphaerae bacterium]HOQ84775.1 phospho-N-acetylmuramoyl-pentapeptide-transferase [Phycisphaerae bacterium]HPP26263.1 phospho-N-acetylmuramoyl-pentapeptide-transferase [Phycisphaerae bacterium]
MLYLLYEWWRDWPEGPYAYKDPLFRGTCAILLGFAIVWFIGPKVIRQLAMRKIGDNADFDHSRLNEFLRDKKNTPTMGGIMIISAIAICVLLLSDLRNYYIRLGLFCMVWLTVLGGIDDWLKLTVARRSGTRDGLKSYEKLLFQIGLGVLLGIFVYRYGQENSNMAMLRGASEALPSFRILVVPFYKPGILLGIPAFLILTVLVTAGTSNAVNLTDGMDGLAAGCMALCSFVFMVLSAMGGDPAQAHRLLFPHIPDTGELAILCGAIMGSCLGFLWYNCHPAQVFMGDTGSLPLGGLIGYVAIVTRQELMLLIVGGVFVIEALSVIIQVGYFKTTGKRFFRVAPIHHHFHLGGWTETQTVIRFWLVAAIFAGVALATIRLR